jgi:hypothetical protein
MHACTHAHTHTLQEIWLLRTDQTKLLQIYTKQPHQQWPVKGTKSIKHNIIPVTEEKNWRWGGMLLNQGHICIDRYLNPAVHATG